MLNKITIKNFKGIKEGQIENLGKINVLIGKNNSGKSTILESLRFIRASIKPIDELGKHVQRQLLRRRVRRDTLDMREFVYNYDWDNLISINTHFNNIILKVETTLSGIYLNYDFKTVDKNKELFRFKITTKNNIVSIESENRSTQLNNAIDFMVRIKQNNKDNLEFFKLSNISVDDTISYLRFFGNCTLIDAEFIREIESVEKTFWGKIISERADKSIAEIVNKAYGVGIEHFTMTSYVDGRYKLFTALPEISMHIDDYGEGFRYAVAILTIASQLNNTMLLLEEPEVHQHVGALKPLFTALSQIAKKNNLQLFISTHSQDLLKALTSIPDTDVRIFHTTLSEGLFKVRELSSIDTKLMLDMGIDIRLIDTPFTFLVLEGKEDKTFFNAIVTKLLGRSLDDLGYITTLMSKDGQNKIALALASTGKDVIIQRDYDSEDLDQIVQSFHDTLKGLGKCKVAGQEIFIPSTGSTVTLLPTGLPNDEDLGSIGINRHSMEDYLLKLLSIDERVKEWADYDLRGLRQCADSFKGLKRVKLNSSKAILSMLGSLKNGLSTEDLINIMIMEKTDEKSLKKILDPIVKLLSIKEIVY